MNWARAGITPAGMVVRGLVAILFALVLAPSALAAQATSVVMLSDSGDYIGGGVPRWYHPGNAQVTVGGSTGYLTVNVSGGNLGDYFSMDFAAPPGQALAPGTYVGAQRAPFREAGRPGIDIGGDGRGCNTIEGQFEVKAFDLNADGTLRRLWIVYEQHCEGGEAALFGEVRVGVDAPDGALVSPTILRWPATDVGRPGPAAPVTVVAAENLTIADASIGGTNAGDFLERVDECTGKSLTAGSTCQVYVRPTASGAGVREATLTIKDGAGRVHEVALQAFAYGGTTRWHMVSEQGDYIGQGQTWDYSPADGDLIAAGGSRQYVSFGVNGADDTYWGASFRPASGDIIAAGNSYSTTSGAQLDVSGEGRGCGGSVGSFTVNSAEFNDDGGLRAASVSFEQRCGAGAPALRGKLEYRAGDTTPLAPWMVASGGGGGAPSPFGGQPQQSTVAPQGGGGAAPPAPQPEAPATARCGTREYLVSLVISGTDRADRLRGLPRGDMLVAGPGNDRVYGFAGDDCMDGGPGNDRLSGGAGKDLVDGNRGNDLLGGGSGADVLAGAGGRDRLIGGSGRDVLDGGPGRDRLDCGPGRDVAIRGKGDRYVRCERIVAPKKKT